MKFINPARIDVVTGGQFGSEAKGHVTEKIIRRLGDEGFGTRRPIVNVRVAGPNAGHTAVNEVGKALALRTIPVGVVWENTLLHLGPGSEVDIDVLRSEIEMVGNAGHTVMGRFSIHGEATILAPEHVYRETGMHEKIGSTGKGIGAARADRIMRTAKRIKDDAEVVDWLTSEGIAVVDDDEQAALYTGKNVVIEGTQGYGLGLHAGHYPQCTSSDTRAVDFCAMAGLDPTMVSNPLNYVPWVVLRPYPIRVAGNSGPLAGETSWEALGLPEERTTVTKKVRRVGTWDVALAQRAIRANGPSTAVAFTMFDQICPEAQGLDGLAATSMGWTQEMNDLLQEYGRTLLMEQPGYGEQFWMPRLVTTSAATALWMW